MPTIGLGAIKQASSDVDISKIKGTYANGNTSYTYTTPNLMSGDSYTFAFVSKDTVRFVANNLVQTVGSIKPVTVTSAVGGYQDRISIERYGLGYDIAFHAGCGFL